jgi:hypothetical protein
MKPPPPGAVLPEVVKVRIVPAAWLLPAVLEHVEPDAAIVAQESMELPTVHVVELVDEVTVYNAQVMEVPA